MEVYNSTKIPHEHRASAKPVPDDGEVTDGMGEAIDSRTRVTNTVAEIREGLQLDMEQFSRRAGDLRDQAAVFEESAEIIRRFLYPNENKGMDVSKKMAG